MFLIIVGGGVLVSLVLTLLPSRVPSVLGGVFAIVQGLLLIPLLGQAGLAFLRHKRNEKRLNRLALKQWEAKATSIQEEVETTRAKRQDENASAAVCTNRWKDNNGKRVPIGEAGVGFRP